MAPASLTRPWVLVSWDGESLPLAMIHLDAKPEFDWLLFDFSGRATPGPASLRGQTLALLSQATECKGEIYQALAAHLQASGAQPEFLALIDDDILISVSDINRALHLGRCLGLDVFSPTLSHDSVYTHRWTLSQGRAWLREVDWVEVMMPIYRLEVFRAAAPHLAGNVSSWGIDKYLIPTAQQLCGATRTALLDAVVASHRRPVTSGLKVYRNGLTAGQESATMKTRCQALIAGQKPELVDSDWYRRIFIQRKVRSRWQMLLYGLGRPLRRWLDAST